MSMDGYFAETLRRLRMTKAQRADAKTKYSRVAKTLHNAFYDTNYDGSTKLLIGSYGKKTNIRPPGDVDLLFKIPAETYEQYLNQEGNGPSSLLQKVRKILGDKYTTTEKISAWGKVVLIKFSDGTHDIELLPAYEIDGVFMIPNTEGEGSWESFDARADLKTVSESNQVTNGKTRKLIKLVKRWRKINKTMTIKSYEIEQYCAKFLAQQDTTDLSWSQTVADYFSWLSSNVDKDLTFIETARARALKARTFEQRDLIPAACQEWSKVFGSAFPAYSKHLDKIFVLTQRYPSSDEEFIEDLFPVRLSHEHSVTISSKVTGAGFMPRTIGAFLTKYTGIPRNMKLEFTANSTAQGPIEYWWKVRNFGDEAKKAEVGKGLRGEITSTLNERKHETTLYNGTHYVECYLIKAGICIAKALQFVPISKESAEE